MEKVECCHYHQATITDQNGQLQTSLIPVVQELARQGIKHLPDQFIQTPPPSISTSKFEQNSAHIEAVPGIDVDKLRVEFDPKGRTQELAKLARSAKEWGLFLIKNHGIEDWILDDVKECVKGFFGLSFEEKKDSVLHYMNTDNMGYGRNFVKSEDQRLEWIDRLTMMAAPKEVTEGLHVWPLRPPNFRQAVEKYVEEARKLLNELIQALAEALSLDKNTFLQYLEPKQSEIKVRINYYPPCPRPDQAIGINPHSDASALTLLMEFGATGGLQIFNDNIDRWITVSWPKEMLLVNLGDLIEIMSNGKMKSPWHRVVTQMEEERFSMALFYNPPPDLEIEPLGDGEMSYKKVNIGEYVKNYYDVNPTDSKKAIMFAKYS